MNPSSNDNMGRVIDVALCGIGGYGESLYLTPLLKEAHRRRFRFVGAIDPVPTSCTRLDELKDQKIPIFSDLNQFYANRTCDLMIVCSPIQFHSEHTCQALAHGSHVLCEKPLCAVPKQVETMLAAERASGKTVTVGYQWSFSPAILKLKRDCALNRFGAPKRFRSMVCWPRPKKYFTRNRWAGAQRGPRGEWILDSPVNNAGAHFLHNMFYVMGLSNTDSDWHQKIEAELFRANAIANYDTAVVRIETSCGTEVFFAASHATQGVIGPTFIYEFENATIHYADKGNIIAYLADGGTVDYGSPDEEPLQKLWCAVKSARTGERPLCGIKEASPHTHCVGLIQKSRPGIQPFPSSLVGLDIFEGEPLLFVKGLQELLLECFQEGKLIRDVTPQDGELFATAELLASAGAGDENALRQTGLLTQTGGVGIG